MATKHLVVRIEFKQPWFRFGRCHHWKAITRVSQKVTGLKKRTFIVNIQKRK
jgi:uncharacterized ParB-like nuclease family protein